MTTRTQITIGVIASLIIFPFLLVYAQSEGDIEVPAETQATEATPAVVEPIVEDTTESTPEAAETVPEIPAVTESTSESETPAPTGEVLGASNEVTEESAFSAESASTTPGDEELVDPTASSTPPVEEPKPIEEPFVLQPAVKFSVAGNSASAAIELQNLTCKSCEKSLPDLDVIAYYTSWYPNDGPAESYNDSKTHSDEETITVSGLANWSSQNMSWSAQSIAPGRYYFVVEVDPENANDAYRLYRSEFSI